MKMVRNYAFSFSVAACYATAAFSQPWPSGGPGPALPPAAAIGAAPVPGVTKISASGASQTITFAASGNTAYDITLSANCVITISGGTSGQYQLLTLILRQPATGSGYTVTLPPQWNGTTGVRYSGQSAPTVSTALGTDTVITYSTPDGGTTYFGGL